MSFSESNFIEFVENYFWLFWKWKLLKAVFYKFYRILILITLKITKTVFYKNDIPFPLASLLEIHCYYQDKHRKPQKLWPKSKHCLKISTNYTSNIEKNLTNAQNFMYQKEYAIKIRLVEYLFKKVPDLGLFTWHKNFVCQGQKHFIIESANKRIQNMFNVLFPNMIDLL